MVLMFVFVSLPAAHVQSTATIPLVRFDSVRVLL
jgi:hypothetical protein